MVNFRDPDLGRFFVEVELANFYDIARAAAGDLAPDAVRRMKVRGMVDSGATRMVVPTAVVDQLGLPIGGRTEVKYADGRIAQRDVTDGVRLTFGDRHGNDTAIIEPGRDTPLIGAIVLEDLDLLVDCTHQQLVPRDPRHTISEVEAAEDDAAETSHR